MSRCPEFTGFQISRLFRPKLPDFQIHSGTFENKGGNLENWKTGNVGTLKIGLVKLGRPKGN